VQSVADFEGWSRTAQVRQATVALAGRARAECRALLSTACDPVSWDDFADFLRTQFGLKNPVRHYTRTLTIIKQGSQKPVSAYCFLFASSQCLRQRHPRSDNCYVVPGRPSSCLSSRIGTRPCSVCCVMRTCHPWKGKSVMHIWRHPILGPQLQYI
jgi:hypothetical protein